MSRSRIFLTSILLLLSISVFAEAAIIEGVVVAEHGALGGAVVNAYPALQNLLSGDKPIYAATADKVGYFRLELPAGTYFLTASASKNNEKYFSFHGANPVKVDEKSIWLPFAAALQAAPVANKSTASTLVGTVYYKGKPVADAQVSLYALMEKSLRGLGVQTKSTDINGRFSLESSPASYIVVARRRVGANTKMPLAKGDLFCFSAANPVTIIEGAETALDIHCYPKDNLGGFLAPGVKVKRTREELSRFRERKPLKSERIISGRVLNRDGQPVGGLQVTAYLRDPGKTFQMYQLRLSSENMVRTDASGRYALPVANSGSYYLVARQYGGESPLKGELYGLYEANADHAVEVGSGAATADIVVGMVMGDGKRSESPDFKVSVKKANYKAPAVIDRDTTWSGEVFVEGAVLVARTATLTIEPGTVIRFKRVDRDNDGIGDGELRVTGRILSRGTPEKPVRFMSAESEPRPADWSYLLLFTSGDKNVIEHTVFEHAFTGLQVHFSRAVVRDSIFEGNREGIRFGRAELEIEHNKIFKNEIGIRHHRLEGAVTILDNIITENGVGIFLVPSNQNFVDFSADTYIPDTRYHVPPVIKNNIIANNRTYNYKLGERLAIDIPLTENWWETLDRTEADATIFDRKMDQDLGRVKTLPMLSAPPAGVGPRKE